MFRKEESDVAPPLGTGNRMLRHTRSRGPHRSVPQPHEHRAMRWLWVASGANVGTGPGSMRRRPKGIRGLRTPLPILNSGATAAAGLHNIFWGAVVDLDVPCDDGA